MPSATAADIALAELEAEVLQRPHVRQAYENYVSGLREVIRDGQTDGVVVAVGVFIIFVARFTVVAVAAFSGSSAIAAAGTLAVEAVASPEGTETAGAREPWVAVGNGHFLPPL